MSVGPSRDPDEGRNELEREEWHFLVAADQWNFLMRDSIDILDPREVIWELPKMEDPASLRLKGKCNRIQKKLDRLISIQFALQKKSLCTR